MLHLRQLAFIGGEEDFSAPIAPHPMFLPPSSGIADNGKTIFDWMQAAEQITRGGNSWNAFLGTSLTITYAFRSTAPSTMPNGTGGFSRFSDVQITAAEAALQYWADVANITFTRIGAGTSGEGAYSNDATILFGNYSTGADNAAAFAFFAAVGHRAATDQAGDVWVNNTLDYNINPVVLEYGPQVLLHEIGHALGLEHPGDYDASDTTAPTYDANAVYWQDTRMFTAMSYFGSANTGGSLPGFSNGPQLHDIAAIQRLYGANTTTRTGDTVYGFHSNTGESHFTIASGSQGAVFAIWDAGGVDTLDLSGYSTNSDIDLREEAFSSAGPGDASSTITTDARYNISIARGVVIENAIGGSGNDTLTGNGAANVLNGGAGADAMAGGTGNDTYVVDNAGDVVTEDAGAGVDTVKTSISYSLGANLEKLTLTGAAALNATGNALANILTGNSAANTLDGGAGADTMYGGGGNDLYVVDNVGDSANEGVNLGIDTVKASVSYTLGANIEKLILIGAAAVGAGNALSNTLTGDSVANTLDGKAGADAMYGGAGNDLYVVDNAGDGIHEAANRGVDTVRSTVSFALSDNVEKLILSGAAVSGTGNALANTLTGDSVANTLTGNGGDDLLYGGAGGDTLSGNDGNDVFYGSAGHDTLIGGAGADHFVFSSLNAADSDTISDFSHADDSIDLDNSVLTALGADGALASTAFWSSTTGVAHDADDRVIYNSSTGQLFYDADGNGAGAAVLIATLSGHPALDATDFGVI